MDTTKSATKVDEADDLIDELARLMADDAQINSPSSKTVSKNEAPISLKPSQAGPAQAKVPSAPGAPLGQAAIASTKAEPFDLKGFDLGAPKAQTSSIENPPPVAATVDPAIKLEQNKTTAETTSSLDSASDHGASSQEQPSEPPSDPSTEFEFNFATEQNQTQETNTNTNTNTDADIPPEQAPYDPIADLINAAVSKHDASADVDIEDLAAQPLEASQSALNQDTFVTPPVFGLNGTPSDPSPAPEETLNPEAPKSDNIGGSLALDELESLIGNSVQLDASVEQGDTNAQLAVEGPTPTTKSQNQTLSEAVDNLATKEAPIATLPNEAEPEVSNQTTSPDSAEGAILQAMAAAGTATAAMTMSSDNKTEAKAKAKVKSAKPTTGHAPITAADRVAKKKKSKVGLSGYLVPMLGILVVGAIGVGAYFWLNPATNSADAPVLIADPSPTRQVPAATEEEAGSVVLNQIDNTSTAPVTENLVSRDQTNGATGNAVRQVITIDNSETVLANRRVRTVTVRPDGTIISGDEAVAGGQVLPVDQPNLPELPADAVNTELSNTIVAALPIAAAETVNVETVTVNGSTVPFPKPRLTNRIALAARAATTVAEAQLPISAAATPSTQTSAVNLIADTAASAVAATPIVAPVATSPVVSTPAPVAPTPTLVSNPQAHVQLASQRSQAVANQTASNLQSRYSSALNGGQLIVRRVDLGTRGVYYRVQLPAATLGSANSICSAVKNAGGDCFVASN